MVVSKVGQIISYAAILKHNENLKSKNLKFPNYRA